MPGVTDGEQPLYVRIGTLTVMCVLVVGVCSVPATAVSPAMDIPPCVNLDVPIIGCDEDGSEDTTEDDRDAHEDGEGDVNGREDTEDGDRDEHEDTGDKDATEGDTSPSTPPEIVTITPEVPTPTPTQTASASAPIDDASRFPTVTPTSTSTRQTTTDRVTTDVARTPTQTPTPSQRQTTSSRSTPTDVSPTVERTDTTDTPRSETDEPSFSSKSSIPSNPSNPSDPSKTVKQPQQSTITQTETPSGSDRTPASTTSTDRRLTQTRVVTDSSTVTATQQTTVTDQVSGFNSTPSTTVSGVSSEQTATLTDVTPSVETTTASSSTRTPVVTPRESDEQGTRATPADETVTVTTVSDTPVEGQLTQTPANATVGDQGDIGGDGDTSSDSSRSWPWVIIALLGGTGACAVTLGVVVVKYGALNSRFNTGRLGKYEGHVVDRARDGLDWLKWFVPLRYSSWNDEDVLENDKRESIHTAVKSQPGKTLPLSALAEETGIPRSTVRKNAHILVQTDHFGQEEKHGERCYYSKKEGKPSTVARRLAQAWHNKAMKTNITTLARDGPLSVADLARKTDRSSGTVSPQLRRLETDGIIESERSGRSKQYSLTGRAKELGYTEWFCE